VSDVHDDAAGSGWARLLVVLACRGYRAVLLTLAAVAGLPVLAGWGSYVVSSDSMRPSIGVGDVVLARPTGDDHRVRVGRVYVFDDPAREGRLLVHRIVERRDDGAFTTAGDANDVTDLTPLDGSGIRAQAILLAPHVGLPVHWARTGEWTRLGLWLLLSCAAFAIASSRLAGERASRRRRRVAVATAVAVGAVGAGTSGAAGATFTARTVSSGWAWTAGAWVQPYVGAVLADQPYGLWLLDEPAGGQYASDRSGNNRTGEYLGSVTSGSPGGLPRNPGTSVRATGGRVVLGTQAVAAPSSYSIELWFRTTATSQTYLAGFEDDRDAGYSLFGTEADRSVTMESNGRLTFGNWPWRSQALTTPRAYNDGAWHHLVVTSSNRATTIYVDGAAVASGTTSSVGGYTGFWRVGQGSIGLFNTPAFHGDLDNVAIYHSVLPPARVAAHWAAR
jgi:signal peptidase I